MSSEWSLKTVYKPTPAIKLRSIVIHLEDWNIYAEMVINKSQRHACSRLFKHMAKGPIVKISVDRWIVLGVKNG